MKILLKRVIKNKFILRNMSHYILKMKLYSKYYLRNIYNKLDKKKKILSYPKTLQFPITNKCNLNCIMCNIHGNNSDNELSSEEIQNILSDDIFKKIESVGINGGEPYLIVDLIDKVKVIIQMLPNLKNLYFISNGTMPKSFDKMIEIKKLCSKKNITFTQSFSIDGYGNIHDEMRGRNGTFSKIDSTINTILKDKNLYCDSFNFICTLTKKNIYYVNELEAYAQKKGITITYNIATEHVRLKNESKYLDYSLFTDNTAKMLACEFLYTKFKETKSKTYFGLFKYLESENPDRVANCQFLHEGITLTPNGDICYCATHSKTLINMRNYTGSIAAIYFKNKNYNSEIKEKYCNTCSHYMGALDNKAYKEYINELLKFTKKPLKG